MNNSGEKNHLQKLQPQGHSDEHHDHDLDIDKVQIEHGDFRLLFYCFHNFTK